MVRVKRFTKGNAYLRSFPNYQAVQLLSITLLVRPELRDFWEQTARQVGDHSISEAGSGGFHDANCDHSATPVDKMSMEDARSGAALPRWDTPSAHDSRRLLTFHAIYQGRKKRFFGRVSGQSVGYASKPDGHSPLSGVNIPCNSPDGRSGRIEFRPAKVYTKQKNATVSCEAVAYHFALWHVSCLVQRRRDPGS